MSNCVFSLVLLLFLCSTCWSPLCRASQDLPESIKVDLLSQKNSRGPVVRFYLLRELEIYPSSGRFSSSPESRRQWNNIKQELADVASQTTNPCAADASLVLACGELLFDNDRSGAIRRAMAITSNFPTATSTLVLTPLDFICCIRLEPYLLYYMAYLYGCSDADPQYVRGFSEKKLAGVMKKYKSMKEKKTRTSDLARMFIATSWRYGESADRLPALDPMWYLELVTPVLSSYSPEELRLRRFADMRDYTPFSLDWETTIDPEAAALALLIQSYIRLGNWAMLTNACVAWTDTISPDGWYWRVNETLAQAVSAREPQLAQRQYQLVLQAKLDQQRRALACYPPKEAERRIDDMRRHGIEFIRNDILKTKRRIRAVGGAIELDIHEVDQIWSKPERPLDCDDIGARYTSLVPRLGDTRSAIERCAAATNLIAEVLTNQIKWLSSQPRAAISNRFELIMSLLGLSQIEQDAQVRGTIVSHITVLLGGGGVQTSTGTISSAEIDAVNSLVAQLDGRHVAGGVPFPSTQLSSMPVPALLHAATFVKQGTLTAQGGYAVMTALAATDQPVLLDFYIDMLTRSSDRLLRRCAAIGIERIARDRAEKLTLPY